MADDPRAAVLRIREEVAKVVVGQDAVLTGLVVALLVRGHVLLEGVPGVAKTLLVKVLAASLDLDFKRVQFTPDLMPSDVTGQVILEGRDFRFRPGPVFTNLLLADEINRTPPKTQSALLEAMEERQVTVGGRDPAPARPVRGGRHPEPGGVRGHLPAARGPARPVHAEAGGALPDGRAGAGGAGPPPPGHEPPRPGHPGDHGGGRRRPTWPRPAGGGPGGGGGQGAGLHRRHRAGDPGVAVAGPGRVAPRRRHAAGRGQGVGLPGRASRSSRPDEVKAVAKPALRHRIALRPEVELEGVTADGVLDGVLAAVPVPR